MLVVNDCIIFEFDVKNLNTNNIKFLLKLKNKQKKKRLFWDSNHILA